VGTRFDGFKLGSHQQSMQRVLLSGRTENPMSLTGEGEPDIRDWAEKITTKPSSIFSSESFTDQPADAPQESIGADLGLRVGAVPLADFGGGPIAPRFPSGNPLGNPPGYSARVPRR
jgi:hypothetical protein